MESAYERTIIIITEFDTEDVITTSGITPQIEADVDNSYKRLNVIKTRGSWF